MLEVELFGFKLKNPLLPAAGPLTANDKWVKKIYKQGVGAIVLKTISTTAAQVKRPAIIKLPYGVMNCELWSEEPPDKWVKEFLPRIKEFTDIPIIGSVGYKPEELRKVIPMLEPFVDMFEVSTHYTGYDTRPVYEAAVASKEATKKPVMIKLSPHSTELSSLAKAAVDGGADGIVAINSVGPALSIDIKRKESRLGAFYGWLSGPAIKPIALKSIYEIRKAVSVPIVAAGGVKNADDVIEFMLAGATAVQMLSSAIMYGIELYSKIIRELPDRLKFYGFESAKETIGTLKEW